MTGTKTWTAALPYFGRDELATDHGLIRLDARFATALTHLRLSYGYPMALTSCCRSPEHNARVGGHPRSMHLTENHAHPTNGCMAADVAWGHWDVNQRRSFYLLAKSMGWSIGLADDFVHVDRRVDVGLERKTYTYDGWNPELLGTTP